MLIEVIKLIKGKLFSVFSFEFQVSGFGFRVSGFGFQVSGFRFRVSGFGFVTMRASRAMASLPVAGNSEPRN